MNIKALGTALKNKAGAPGRFLYDTLKKPHDDLNMKRADERYAFIKDRQAKRKSGVPVSAKDEAIYQSMK